MPANPLSQEQIDNLKAAKAAIPAIKEQIKLAKLADIDVGELEVTLAAAEDRVNKLLRVYGSLPTAESLTGE